MPEAELGKEAFINPIYHPDVTKFLERKRNKGRADRIRKYFDQKAQQLYRSGGEVPASWTPFRHPEVELGCFSVGTKHFGAIVRVIGDRLEVIKIGSSIEEVVNKFK